MRKLFFLLLVSPSLVQAQLLPTQAAERCVAAPAGASATGWLKKAIARVMPAADGRVLRYRAGQDVHFWEQSDRMYAPFIPNMQITVRWHDLVSGAEARQTIERPVTPTQYPAQIFRGTTAYARRDTLLQTIPFTPATVEAITRQNPWMVLANWRANAAASRVVQRCLYRDAWRTVLEWNGERLYLGEVDATPIKLERMEPHYLWGQVKAEYLWTTWWGVRGAPAALFPLATFRVFDGEVYERIGVQMGTAAMIPADSAPRLSVAAALPLPPGQGSQSRPQIERPDTVRVGDSTFLLVTPAYTQTVTLQKDTIYLFDATSSEARARGDSAVIAKLFPGKHPVVVVVTDVAWPHISGVRFWVARGATIVSHGASEDFLRRVVSRKWTMAPDALENSRTTARFRFRAVADSLKLAGGAVVVHALQGASTETAVGVWMPNLRYFWAGDYIQGGFDSPYQRDVVRTVKTLGLTPLTVGAQHIKLTDWSGLDGKD